MVLQHIDNMINKWQEEREIHLEIKEYKETINTNKIENEDEKFDLNFHNDYIKFIDGAYCFCRRIKNKTNNNKFDI